ncbi:MAG TPA: hypothetical protein VLT86_00330 [Vicinamibacterales bacterium]|nr:hypothetical protein [Vicinamibacterales bacterium]
MASKKTWIWIIVGVLGACVLALFLVAGAGVYFVSQHVSATRSTSADALDQFDKARAEFKDQSPLFELDDYDRVRPVRRAEDLPTSATRPDQLWILAWNPNEEPQRVVKVSVPFWILRLGRRKFDVMSGERAFDVSRLRLDVNELERIGPVLVLDYRRSSGERVMIWTK